MTFDARIVAVDNKYIHVLARFINGLGEEVLTMSTQINNMANILEASVNAGIRFTDTEWENLLASENVALRTVEAIINKQFDGVGKDSILPNLKTFLRMGGVTVEFYGATVELGWFAQVVQNIEEFFENMGAEAQMPSVMEMYGIFANGISHKFANIFDTRDEVIVPLVNGMVTTITRARIMSVNYQGNF